MRAQPSAVSSSTDRNGTYMMLLDPGNYRLDIDPPAGTPWPRLTEDGDKAVVIAANPVTHNIVLPAGEVIVGHVSGADQRDLDAATLTFFEILCQTDTCSGTSRVAPALRSQVTTQYIIVLQQTSCKTSPLYTSTLAFRLTSSAVCSPVLAFKRLCRK